MAILQQVDVSPSEDSEHNSLVVPAAAFCRRLKLAETVDGLVESEMELGPGMLVQLMVLDTLSGRSPLYHLQNFAAAIDRELLLGKDVDPTLFNDTNVGRMLDAIAQCGTGRILCALGTQAVQQFYLDPSLVSYDTTSVSVWGDYAFCEADEATAEDGLRITYGHSKDLRRDLK